MTLQSRILEAAKNIDAWAGAPLARRVGGARRPLPSAVDDALLVRLWGLGNLTLLAPVLAGNRGRRLRLLTLSRNAPFVTHHFPRVEVLTLPAPHEFWRSPTLIAVLRALHRDPPDVVVDLEDFLRLPLALVRSACPAPIVGMDTPRQGRGPLLDRAVPDDPTRHLGDTYAAVCAAAGLEAPPGPGGLRVGPRDRRALRGRVPPGPGPLVVVHPGTGDHAPVRRWSAERFGRLAAALVTRRNARVLVTGVRREASLVRRVVASSGGRAHDACGRFHAGAFAALLARADLLVTNDTGPLHMADALGTRSVALYGPASPLRCGPRRPGSIALYADLPCSPCLDARTLKRTRCAHHACLTALGVEAAWRAAEQALDPRSAAHGRV